MLLTRLRVRVLLNLCAVYNQLGKHAKSLQYAEESVALVTPVEASAKSQAEHGFEPESPCLPPIKGESTVSALSLATSPLAMTNEERQTHRAMALHNCCVCYEHLGRLSNARHAAHEALGAARAVLPSSDPLLHRLEDVARAL